MCVACGDEAAYTSQPSANVASGFGDDAIDAGGPPAHLVSEVEGKFTAKEPDAKPAVPDFEGAIDAGGPPPDLIDVMGKASAAV